ncbi:hypothetical protein PIB30_043658 [Stylosanthes scabra]|uniref:Phasin domain-containing protein n=1 Tax=Stylosanthes scabra TaxID=79078 RepID=A0ABU6YEG9_9FABA|nr:hypothetical protein [Stylosanthes scabra]
MDKAMIDASAGGALMNKTPEEASELIESIADNHQCFKTKAASSVRGIYEIAPSDTTVLAKSLTDITNNLIASSHNYYEEAFRLSQQENKEMREVAKRTEAQISHLTDLMIKFVTQILPNTSAPPPPPNPSPLPSQPLPEPNG